MTEIDAPQSNEDPQANLPAKKTDMTVPEMRQWLRNWVGKAVGKSPDDIDESIPMVELGLASRDAVATSTAMEHRTTWSCSGAKRTGSRSPMRFSPVAAHLR